METNLGESQESEEYSFKSYYVVWKLVGADTYFLHVMSLNRTM